MVRLSAIVSIALMFSLTVAVPEPAFAQKKVSPDQVSDWGSFLWTCMKAKFPEISLSGDGRSAYDHKSQRNFAREGDTWIDVKTLEVVCPVKQSDGGWSGWGRFLWTCMKAKFPEISLSGDGQTAYDPESKRNFAREGDTWIDMKTLEVVCPKLKPSTAQQPTPPTGKQVGFVPPVKLNSFDQRILDLHNGERVAVGVPPLRWNPALEQSATEYAGQLARTGQLVHAPREGRGIERENLSQGLPWWGPDQLLNNWIREKQDFTPGLFPDVARDGNWLNVAHYTQMIWPTTTDLGCGEAAGGGYKWLVCRYSPGGNKDGKPVGMPPTIAANTAKTAATVYQWIDVKTGKPVFSPPYVPDSQGHYHVVLPDAGDPNRAYDPESGRNFARENGQWIDVKTGKRVFSPPYVPDSNGRYHVVLPDAGDPNRAFDPDTGRNFAREPV